MKVIKSSGVYETDVSEKKVVLGSHFNSTNRDAPVKPAPAQKPEIPEVFIEPKVLADENLAKLSKVDALELFNKYFHQDLEQLKNTEREQAKKTGFDEGLEQGKQQCLTVEKELQEKLKLCSETITGLSHQVSWQFSNQEHVIPLIMEAVLRILENELSEPEKHFAMVTALFEEYARDKPKKLKLPALLAEQLKEYMTKVGYETEVTIAAEPEFGFGRYELVLETGSVEKDLQHILESFKEGLLTLSEVEDE